MRFTIVLAAALALQATSLFAQAPPKCDGTYAVVRISEIKAGGSISGFMEAAAAHKAWYRANGITDNDIVMSRVILRDPKTGAQTYSEKEILSYHLNPPSGERTPHRGDAAWNAYVKMYRDNSNIKSEYLTCMPKMPQP
jgi:hypothetical protein